MGLDSIHTPRCPHCQSAANTVSRRCDCGRYGEFECNACSVVGFRLIHGTAIRCSNCNAMMTPRYVAGPVVEPVEAFFLHTTAYYVCTACNANGYNDPGRLLACPRCQEPLTEWLEEVSDIVDAYVRSLPVASPDARCRTCSHRKSDHGAHCDGNFLGDVQCSCRTYRPS